MIKHNFFNCDAERWFHAITNKPGIETRRIFGKRYSCFYYSYLGKEIAAKYEKITRRKVTEIEYHLYKPM